MENQLIDIVQKSAMKQYGSFRQFSMSMNKNDRNFKVQLANYFEKINDWLAPLGLEIHIKERDKNKDN